MSADSQSYRQLTIERGNCQHSQSTIRIEKLSAEAAVEQSGILVENCDDSYIV